MEISAAAVKSLREKTNLPLMQVKKALQEAGGDEDRAIAILKEQVGTVIAKRSDNATNEGRIFVKVSEDGQRRMGALDRLGPDVNVLRCVQRQSHPTHRREIAAP